MDPALRRMHRLIDVWNRLPVFRVVAETEHLPTASARLGVSAPALSRTIKLLEESVGVALFERRGRRMQLSDEGRLLLRSVRTAMRELDSGLDSLREHEVSGRVAVSTIGMFTPLAVAALAQVTAAHPKLVPHLTHRVDNAVPSALLRGELDLALLQRAAPDPELQVEALALCPYAVYCGPGHPLAERTELDADDLEPWPFVAPPPTNDGAPTDFWPAERPRTVGMTIVQVEVAVRVCAAGALLAVLPVPVVESTPLAGSLRRLPVDLIPSSTLFAVSRRPVGERRGRTAPELVLDAVRGQLELCHFVPLVGDPGVDPPTG